MKSGVSKGIIGTIEAIGAMGATDSTETSGTLFLILMGTSESFFPFSTVDRR